MTGPFNACSPDRPGIWLCHQIRRDLPGEPPWMTESESRTLSQLAGGRRSEFLTSRWLIRQGLANASGQMPAYCQPVDGRPVRSAMPANWCLSLSHSKGLSAVATGTSPLGIDIEPSQRKPDWGRVAKRWFSAVEQEWLFRANDPFSFLKVWTLKEAWLKATGRGIAGNLQTLEVRKDFELYGDRPDQQWLASCFYIEGFLVTLVYQGTEEDSGSLPAITLLEPPPDDYDLIHAGNLGASWEPMFHRTIRTRR
ncbi:MAG: 4'-phosphopantetheinyl transferase [Marinobacter excellens HL-55]|uniref:4'-phosphopantetheinyl transferase n=1 Tax=Marinobacter excellens HL-55 TaxID=1305731 RepID=A0A0P8D476_9GAMM|nr:MAG: 4'-phosphopantetheinyl transferase [Marinobacter excellens HL-55]